MKINIYLISTVHREKGNCTSEKLFEILYKIKPDVIFCEASNDMFDSFREGLIKSSLELNAIKKLSKYHSFSLKAVDSFPELNTNFRNKINEIFYLMSKDIEHKNAWCKNNENTHKFGFEYLNSIENINLFDDLAKIEKNFTSQLVDLEYKIAYQKWLNFHNNRENEMLENINFYIANNQLEKAVFICGSAHRKSFLNKINEHKSVQINWLFELPK